MHLAHWANPQYILELEDTDEDEDNLCSVIVQLMQKDRRKIKQKGENFLYIGFTVYQVSRFGRWEINLSMSVSQFVSSIACDILTFFSFVTMA